MFRIGQFARLSQVSAKALRHWDEIGLLRPARVERQTEYRYYSAAQLQRVQRILSLRELGLSLAQVAELLDRELSAAQIAARLEGRERELEAEIAARRLQVEALRLRRRRLVEEGAQPDYEVTVRSVAPLLVASVRAPLPEDQVLTALFEGAEAHVAEHRARAFAPPLALYHDDGAEPEVEVAIPIRFPVPAAPGLPVRTATLPGVTVASVLHQGPYDQLAQAGDALMRWLEAREYQAAGPLREVYLRFGASPGLGLPDPFLTDTRAELLTELQIPIDPEKGRA